MSNINYNGRQVSFFTSILPDFILFNNFRFLPKPIHFMKKNYLTLLLFFGITVLISCDKKNAKKTASIPTIDMEDFFRNGDKTAFQISPDGQYFSYLSDYNGKLNIFVEKKDDNEPIMVSLDTIRSIYRYYWKGDRIIFTQDIGGDENFQHFSVKPDGSDLKNLSPFSGVVTETMDELYDVSGLEEHIFIVMNKRNPEYLDPYLVNVESGELTLLYDNKENFSDWRIDNTGIIRLALQTDGVNNTWHYRKSEKDAFLPLITTSFRENFNPVGFDKNNEVIYALSNVGRNRITLVEYNPDKKEEIQELFSDNYYDLKSISYDRKKQQLAFVEWNAEKLERFFFDKEVEGIYATLNKKLSVNRIFLMSQDNARKQGVFYVDSDVNPGRFYLFNYNTEEIDLVSDAYHWLKEEFMAEMKPISYPSRDGLTIHGYLTLPKGVPAQNLPVIIHPHGGPWYRDRWGFNLEVQFLANRGYAVLQMNFRGSTGYGRKFWEAGFKEWGKKMQDDITDGVEWIIDQGIADKNRIGIYGASYGGYATLSGITFTPDLYAAAVDYVGVSNLFTFYKSLPPYWKPFLESMKEMVGDPVRDSLLLAEASPALHADKIKTPLFIAQGANDPRVNQNESDQMVKAMKNRGIDVEYMLKEDEGHGFLNQENQFDFYRAMEKFLEKHLKPNDKPKS